MHWDVYLRPEYLKLHALMFMEFAVWAAWMPVLAMRLLGPLKMSGKQTGWIYATFPLACIFAPFASGYLADRWFNAEWIILVSHAVGAVLLFLAARQTKFWGMFWIMLVYCVFFTATLPLVNKVLFRHLPEEATAVFFWRPWHGLLSGTFSPGCANCGRSAATGPTACIWPLFFRY